MADNGGVGSFGAMLAHFRGRTGLSQEKLARKAGVSNSLVSLYETGKRGIKRPDRNIILRLGMAMDLTSSEMDELLMSSGHYPTEAKIRQRRPSFASFVSTEPSLSNEQKNALLAIYDALIAGGSISNGTPEPKASKVAVARKRSS